MERNAPDRPPHPTLASRTGNAPPARTAGSTWLPPDPKRLRKVTAPVIEGLRRHPTPTVITELAEAAREHGVLHTNEFRKLLAYLLESADGRDRREPWTTRAGEARPVPRLRVLIEACFGVYADLHWFNLNKTANAAGQPLLGLYPRMAASLSRAQPEDLGELVLAFLSRSPDAAVLRWVQERGGKVAGIGVEVFSRLAMAYRPDLFFVIPREWGDASGCLGWLDGDLRKYCGLCRNLRAVCDELGYPTDVRAMLLLHVLDQPNPPQRVLEALHHAIGPSVARFATLDANAGWEPQGELDDRDSIPLEFAAESIRARRGRRDLRATLLKTQGERCAFTGSCPRDLLEVAYVVSFPEGDVHAVDNALLLRSDIHTLWDLNLLGVEPDTLTIHVAPQLEGTSYEKLARRPALGRGDRPAPARSGLEERWKLFTAAHPDWDRPRAVRPSTPATPPAAAPASIEVRPTRPGSRAGRGEDAASAARTGE